MAGAVGLVVAAAVIAVVVLGDGDDHPSAWDERVVDLVDFVEEERELDFDHPVHVDFLSADDYSEVTRTDVEDLTEDEREDLEHATALLRSLGLVAGEVDLLESMNELSDSGTLAFYDPDTRRITVRGTEMTVDLRVTLVHELTHALQDQHFDIARLGDLETSGQELGLRAVVEGDASLVEDAYVASLDPDEADEYTDALEDQLDTVPLDDIPSILTALFGAPYALGSPLVGIVHADGGWDAINEALAAPPTTEVELLDPLLFVDGFDLAEVELADAADGVEVVDEGDFGAITLYLVLAARIDPLDAFEISSSWQGDAYRTERAADGEICAVIATTATDGDATDRLEDALSDWVEGTEAEVTRDADVVTLRSCDPGTDDLSDPVTDPIDAVTLAATRSYLIFGMVQQGLDLASSACVGDAVIAEIPLDVLAQTEPSDEEIESVWSTVSSAMGTCITG